MSVKMENMMGQPVDVDEVLDKIKNIIDSKKGEEITLIEIGAISSIADYFVIASGNNENQVMAIVDAIEDELIKIHIKPRSIEGQRQGKWVILDYGNIVVHIFHKDTRYFYNLERVWNDGKITIFDPSIN